MSAELCRVPGGQGTGGRKRLREASGGMQEAADDREQHMGDHEKKHIEMNRPRHNHRQGVGQLEANKQCVST